jgi:aminoglycoside 3-N-acetyltransferase
LTAGLRDLGLPSGAIVVVHSALRSLGRVDGGEDAVIDALLAVTGPGGTVCMPTLTYGDYGPRRPPPPFDVRTTPGVVGRLPERFRRRPGVQRSLHPTHSVAAVGARASELLRDHHRASTPCGADSPWGRIAAAHGFVLMLGVGTHYCTMFHGAEEEAEPELRCGPPTRCRLMTDAGEGDALLRLHRPYRGAVSNRTAMLPVLEREQLVRRGRIGAADVLLIDAHGLWQVSVDLLGRQPSRTRDRVSARSRWLVRRGVGHVRALQHPGAAGDPSRRTLRAH